MAHDEVAILIGPRRLSNDPSMRSCLDMRASITKILESAEEEMIIAAYRLDSEELLVRIEELVQKGVDVRIHLDHAQTKEKQPEAALERLRSKGAIVEIHEEDGYRSLHAKALIADGERAIIGSANLTDRALDRNIEVGIWLEGPSVKHLRNAMISALRS